MQYVLSNARRAVAAASEVVAGLGVGTVDEGPPWARATLGPSPRETPLPADNWPAGSPSVSTPIPTMRQSVLGDDFIDINVRPPSSAADSRRPSAGTP